MTALFLETKAAQLFFGSTLLVAGIAIVPLMGRLLVAMTTKFNGWVFGSLYSWQESALVVFKFIVAAASVLTAVYGAILLAAAAAAGAGLIQSPWE